MRGIRSLLILLSCVVPAIAAQDQVSKGTTAVRQSGAAENEIVVEESEASHPKERETRRAKNVRYNTGRTDLTTRNPEVERFIEQVWPRREIIPASESAVIATGRVVKVQPYLSGDRSRIYTEIVVIVDGLLKRDRDNRISGTNRLVIDMLGGVLKLKTGQVVRDEVQIDYLGKPQIGNRYVFFAKAVHRGNDINLIESYELRSGKVLTNDTRPGRVISTLPGVPSTWENETAFLKAVREITASTAHK